MARPILFLVLEFKQYIVLSEGGKGMPKPFKDFFSPEEIQKRSLNVKRTYTINGRSVTKEEFDRHFEDLEVKADEYSFGHFPIRGT